MQRRMAIILSIIVVVIVIGAGIAVIEMRPHTTTPTQTTFTIGVTQGVKTLDPAIAYDFTSNAAVHNLYDDLMEPVNNNGNLSVGPNVVTSWNVSSNGLNYTLHIRQGIKFHDNTTLTANDVAFSFNRMLAIDEGISYVWSGILVPGNVTAVNQTTVAVNLIKPYAPFISTLVMVYVVNSALVKSHEVATNTTYGANGDYGIGWLSTHDAGSGPYSLKYYDPATEVTFQKFPGYWKGWTSNQPDLAMMQVMPEEAAVKTAILSHSIDMTDYTLLIQTYNDLTNATGLHVQVDPAFNLLMVMMNSMIAPTNNTYVRQAISYAFNYNEALSQILPGDSQAEGPVVNSMPGHNNSVLTYHYNLTKARQLMNESGYTPAELAALPTIKVVYVNSLDWEARVASLLQSDLEQIGINITTVPMPWLQMVSLTANYTTTPNFFILSSTAGYMSTSYYLTRYTMNATGYTSAFWYKNQTLSNLILNAMSTTNQTQRYQMYGDAQGIIAKAAPCIWIANDVHRIAYWNNVQGYQFYGLLGFDIYFWNFHISSSSTSTSAQATSMFLLNSVTKRAILGAF